MFRERFSDVFPKSLPHYGPQEIERGVADIVPGDHIERLLCALVGLVLNRKKDVEYAYPPLSYTISMPDAIRSIMRDSSVFLKHSNTEYANVSLPVR